MEQVVEGLKWVATGREAVNLDHVARIGIYRTAESEEEYSLVALGNVSDHVSKGFVIARGDYDSLLATFAAILEGHAKR